MQMAKKKAKKKKGTDQEQFHVYLPLGLLKEFKKQAIEEELSNSALVEKLVRAYLKRKGRSVAK